MWAAAKNWPPSVWRWASALTRPRWTVLLYLSNLRGRATSVIAHRSRAVSSTPPRTISASFCLTKSRSTSPCDNCPRLTHTSTLYMTFCVLSISELSLSAVRTPRRSISHAHKRLHTHSLHIKNAAASAARPMHALLLLLLLLTVSSSLFSQQASPSV